VGSRSNGSLVSAVPRANAEERGKEKGRPGGRPWHVSA